MHQTIYNWWKSCYHQRQLMQSLSALRHWYNATRYLQNLAIEGVVCLLYIPYSVRTPYRFVYLNYHGQRTESAKFRRNNLDKICSSVLNILEKMSLWWWSQQDYKNCLVVHPHEPILLFSCCHLEKLNKGSSGMGTYQTKFPNIFLWKVHTK